MDNNHCMYLLQSNERDFIFLDDEGSSVSFIKTFLASSLSLSKAEAAATNIFKFVVGVRGATTKKKNYIYIYIYISIKWKHYFNNNYYITLINLRVLNRAVIIVVLLQLTSICYISYTIDTGVSAGIRYCANFCSIDGRCQLPFIRRFCSRGRNVAGE